MTHPYAALTPEVVLNALRRRPACAARRPPARAQQLRESRLPGRDRGRRAVVVKFYRPGRWTDGADPRGARVRARARRAEMPVVAPAFDGERLHGRLPLRGFPRRGGRAPELDDPRVLEWLGRFIGRIHAVGARGVSRTARARHESFGDEPRDFLLGRFVPAELLGAWRRPLSRRSRRRRRLQRAWRIQTHPPARRLPPRQRAVDRGRPALRRPR